MAVTSDWASPNETQRAIKRAMRASELAPAGVLAQLATYLVIVLAIGLAASFTDETGAFTICAIALAAGIAVGVTTPIGRWFTRMSGMVAALVAIFVVFVILALSDGRLLSDRPWLAPLVVGLAVLGLDWSFTPRLRARAVASGILVIPLIGADRDWSYAAAVVWFLGLLVTLWLLERDVRRAALRPVPLNDSDRPSGVDPMGLVRTAGLGLACGLIAALLLADVTCSPRLDESDVAIRAAPGRANIPMPERMFNESYGSYLGLVPEPDRRVPAPSGELERQIDEHGRLVIRDSDGSTFTYDRDRVGRNRVQVDDERGTRTYVYDTSGDEIRVTEYDAGGNRVGEHHFGADRSSATGAASEDEQASRDVPWLTIVAVVLALMALAAVTVWLVRGRGNPARSRSWAEQLAARLDVEGRRRGRERSPDETVVEYATALAGGPLRDARIATVGRLLSTALFGSRQPPPAARAWAETVVDEASEANPTRRRRRRR